MTADELRARAREEAAELGAEPTTDRRDHELWVEERRGAVVLLAAFAEWDASLCRRAAVEAAEWGALRAARCSLTPRSSAVGGTAHHERKPSRLRQERNLPYCVG
jgi:hypothetical protein